MQDVVRDILVGIPWNQILPLLFVFALTPLFALGAYHKTGSTVRWLLAMMLENLGLGFVWSWVNTHDVPPLVRERKSSRKKHMRRSDLSAGKPDRVGEGERYYPGLVNISGTYCFLNSTLQAMASVSYLQPHIEAIHSKAERFDVPTPVIDALRDALIDLNTPTSSPRALRPISLINALSAPTPGKQRSALFSSREHQDAQELFQLLSEFIKNEAKAVDEEVGRDRGLGGLSRAPSEEPEVGAGREIEAGKGVFDGLTANRRSCVECGYTEAVMHFAFDNWQLAVPRMASCRLEDCLIDYTRLELLTDCICRKCSMLATHKRLVAEAEKASEALSSDRGASLSKKKRAREAKKLEARVKAALDEGRIEEDIKGVKMEKVFSRCSTKQAMIARPPPVLALHLNRSIHYGTSGIKNTCRVLFPELLDLTPFTTSGKLSTSPSAPISSPTVVPPPRSNTPTPGTYTPRVLYRLSAVVCHYGAHSFGHYVAYRRKPRAPSAGDRRFDPPTLRCPLGCECDKCAVLGPIRDAEGGSSGMDLALGEMPAYAASRWLRISDDNVEEVGIERVLNENSGTFMLYYERVVQPRLGLWATHSSPRSSEETIKPVDIKEEDGLGVSVMEALHVPRTGARIVRSVYAGRSRSPSVRDLSPVSSMLESMSSSLLSARDEALASGSGLVSGMRAEAGSRTEAGAEVESAVTTLPQHTDAEMPNGVSEAVLAVPNGDAQLHWEEDLSTANERQSETALAVSSQVPALKLSTASTKTLHQCNETKSLPASPQLAHAIRPPSPIRTVGLRA